MCTIGTATFFSRTMMVEETSFYKRKAWEKKLIQGNILWIEKEIKGYCIGYKKGFAFFGTLQEKMKIKSPNDNLWMLIETTMYDVTKLYDKINKSYYLIFFFKFAIKTIEINF